MAETTEKRWGQKPHTKLALFLTLVGAASIIRNLNVLLVYLRDQPMEEVMQQPQFSTVPISEEQRNNLIDFVVAGFAKCGTTTMLKRLNENPQVYMGGAQPKKQKDVAEVHDLRSWDGEGTFFDRYTKEKINNETNLTAPDGSPMKPIIGFKSPEVVRSQPFLQHVVKLFPNVNMIVAVRHPVSHFSSFYNFMVRNKRNGEDYLVNPPSKELIGFCDSDCANGIMKFARPKQKCTPKVEYIHNTTGVHVKKAVCTYLSYFHYGLSRLGMTPLNDEEEWDLLDHHKWSIHSEWKGRLFLVELGQLEDRDSQRLGTLERSFEGFLGLRKNSFTTKMTNEEAKNYRRSQKSFHICDDDHREVREHLIKMGGNAARWIKNYLLESDRIKVPNKEHFVELIDKWGTDPCL